MRSVILAGCGFHCARHKRSFDVTELNNIMFTRIQRVFTPNRKEVSYNQKSPIFNPFVR